MRYDHNLYYYDFYDYYIFFTSRKGYEHPCTELGYSRYSKKPGASTRLFVRCPQGICHVIADSQSRPSTIRVSNASKMKFNQGPVLFRGIVRLDVFPFAERTPIAILRKKQLSEMKLGRIPFGE